DHREVCRQVKVTIKNIFLEEGKVPSIPYGALVPKGFKNLLVAGRCISGDRLAQSAFRVQASCMAMGQAAGTAAYLALTDNCAVGEIDLQQLRGVLAEKGAIVPEVAS
ncbi:MAG TPA: FAD-dependent oxidoreductase, partial [Bacillota bacterium]|nr:FAD-dependent oxidoreductase [Bacillota bacterium]